MSLNGSLHQNGQRVVLYPATVITTALTASVTTPLTGLAGMKYVVVEAIFTYGAGGTTAKAFVQTSLDGGLTWFDIMCFSYTTSSASKVSAVTITTALAAAVVPGSSALTADTILSGVLGDRLRVSVTTTGTYTTATTLALTGIVKG